MYKNIYVYKFVVQPPGHVWLFVTPWTAACQASLAFTIFQSLLKLMSIESVMQSNHLIFSWLLLLPSVFSIIRVFSNELALCIRWPKYWCFSSASVLPVTMKWSEVKWSEVKWKSFSCIWLFAIPRTVAYQAPLFSRQEYWSGFPFPSPGDLPNSGIERRCPTLQVDSLTSEPPGKPKNTGSLSLLQGIFLIQESNQGLLHCRWILYQLSYKENPMNMQDWFPLGLTGLISLLSKGLCIIF